MASFDLPADFLDQFRALQTQVATLGTSLAALGALLAGRPLNVGAINLSWTTGNNASAPFVVAHGLNVIPVFYGAFGADAGAPFLFDCYSFGADDSHFTTRGRFDAGATAASNMSLAATWIAIG